MFDRDRRRHYRGQTDALNFRIGQGEQKYVAKEGDETYLGPFRRDTYHGLGQYLARTITREPWSYEGRFKINKKEGYGVLSFADNRVFSGLYKDDRAFGPGVLTYSDGKQDVGIWMGSQIVRLCTSVGSIESLCKTPRDKIRAVQYKNLINISNEKEDIATKVLRKVSTNPKMLSQASKLYSRYSKNPESHLFDKREILDDLRNVEEDLIEQEKDAVNKLISVYTEIVNIRPMFKKQFEKDNDMDEAVLIAWNNQKSITDIMKHSFIHRNEECETHFNFSNILCNKRILFAQQGEKETASNKILLASELNDSRKILNLLKKYKVNVDVMDNRGNSMILQAAAKDAHDVIRMLNEVFCNINAVNDEGFSALNHSVTRYLALLYDIDNWGKAFLPPHDEEAKGRKAIAWLEDCLRKRSSSSSIPLGRLKKFASTTSTDAHRTSFLEGANDEKSYLFTLRKIQEEPARKITRAQTGARSTLIQRGKSTKYEESPKNRTSIFVPEESEKYKKLMKIEETINLLLDIGADMNASVTPAPLWVLVLFAGNVRIVETLLKNGTDPNQTLNIDKGLLTPLHVLVLAKTLETFPHITELLLEYGADPHKRANADYWSDLWNFLTDFGLTLVPLDGMNPLHTLILRPDLDEKHIQKYLDDIVCILAWNTSEEELFFGLTPLGLAIAKGNLHMMQLLLKCGKIKINDTFHEFWGNPLSTYLRSQGTNSNPDSYKMVRLKFKAVLLRYFKDLNSFLDES